MHKRVLTRSILRRSSAARVELHLRSLSMASVDVPGSLDSQKSKAKRKSYTREFKLKVVTFYRENNIYQTSKFFSLNMKTVLRWAQDEQKIEKAKKGSKHVQHNRRAMYPEVEAELYREYRQLRKRGGHVDYHIHGQLRESRRFWDSKCPCRYDDRK